MSADPVGGGGTVLATVVFSVGEVAITRGEILRWACRFDPGFRARARRRAELAARDTGDDATLEAEIEEATSEFRYARDLETADSLVRWTESNGITVDDWWESIRRSVLERRADQEPDTSLAEPEPATDPGTILSDADLVVSDVLDDATEALARRLSVARGVGQWPARPSSSPEPGVGAIDPWHDALDASWARWRDAQLSEAALRQVIERERLAWLVFDLVESRWASEDAAQEAIACVRVDGMSLEDAAREAGVSSTARACLLADVDAPIRDLLLTAAPGELIGPIERPTGWLLLAVRTKKAPTLDDPLARAAAERALEARAAAPHVAQHVRRERAP